MWTAPQGPSQHARAASIGGLRSGAGPQQQQHIPVGSLARHHSQPMLAPPAPGNAGSNLGGAGGSDIDLSGKYPHPPLHRVQQQGSGVTALPLVSSSHRMYSSRHSDGPSLSSSRHSLDSGIRQYESANNSSRHSDQRTSGYHNPDAGGPGQSMASNSGSGSGSSGLSAHDTRSLGAWSAPPGRSGGGVGSVGGGGGSWAAEHEPRSSFRGDEGSGDESDMMFVTPSFGGQHRRRSTGGGGGPVVGGGGGSGGGRDGFTPGGNGRGDDVDFGGVGGGAGGSDLGSAGSPQFGSSRASGGLLGGGLWSSGASFPAQDLALSPQAALDHAEVSISGVPIARGTPFCPCAQRSADLVCVCLMSFAVHGCPCSLRVVSRLSTALRFTMLPRSSKNSYCVIEKDPSRKIASMTRSKRRSSLGIYLVCRNPPRMGNGRVQNIVSSGRRPGEAR